jgi:hypothetical protein
MQTTGKIQSELRRLERSPFATNVKDDVHSCTHVRTLFTFWTAIYDILTEYLTLFWFAMLVNEYKPYVSIQKSSKDAKFGHCLYLGVPLCYEQKWCAERSGHHLLTSQRRNFARNVKSSDCIFRYSCMCYIKMLFLVISIYIGTDHTRLVCVYGMNKHFHIKYLQ